MRSQTNALTILAAAFAVFFAATAPASDANGSKKPTATASADPAPIVKAEPKTYGAPGEAGRATLRPDLPSKERTYSFLVGAPSAKVVEPGVFEVTFTTAVPTPPAILTGGLNMLDEEVDYPRFHYLCRGQEEGEPTDLITEHKISAKFDSVKYRVPNTPYEPRMTYRVEVFLPDRATSRFFEGRVYFDPETLGDATNVTDGPFVDMVTENSVVISWEADREAKGSVEVDGRVIEEDVAVADKLLGRSDENPALGYGGTIRHAVLVEGLEPDTVYEYSVTCGETKVRPYKFRTSGAETFEFAAMVDSREGNGGGMNNFGGTNAFSLYALTSDAYYRGADFILFPGDLINGYTTSVDDFKNQLQSYRQIMAPVHARIPIYEGMGNHEALLDTFDDGSRYGISFDKEGLDSAEAVFGGMFLNPIDDAPDNEANGGPTYKGNVYAFDYGNARFFVLNNNYWWVSDPHQYGGNLEGYILPKQIEWLREQVAKADADPKIKHLFYAAQEPPYPNGGHTKDAMWYKGGDTNRDKTIDEKDIPIVENRNEMWKIIADSPKSVAFITGDEHAFSRLIVEPKTDVGHKRLPDGTETEFARPIWQVTSGGAGAPWYDKELDLPWSPWLKAHSTQPHYAYFRVRGDDVFLEAYSQTGQRIDAAVLRLNGENVVDDDSGYYIKDWDAFSNGPSGPMRRAWRNRPGAGRPGGERPTGERPWMRTNRRNDQ